MDDVNHIEARIAKLTDELTALEVQLQTEVKTEDFKLVDDNQCLRARMFIDDQDSSKFELYDLNGDVGAQISVSRDGPSSMVLKFQNEARMEIGMDPKTPGSIKLIRPGYADGPTTEIIVGSSNDMMAGIQISMDGQERVFVGIDNAGIAKIALKQADGTINEYGPVMS